MGPPRGSKIPLERTQEISTRRLELDYVAPVRRPHWPGLVVLALSLAVAGGMLARYRDAQREVVRLEAESGLIAPDRRPARAVSRERLEEEAKLAEGVVRQLTLPWAKLIGTIEQAASRDVAILQLRSEEHTSELQSHSDLVCRLLLEKKKKKKKQENGRNP